MEQVTGTSGRLVGGKTRKERGHQLTHPPCKKEENDIRVCMSEQGCPWCSKKQTRIPVSVQFLILFCFPWNTKLSTKVRKINFSYHHLKFQEAKTKKFA